MLQFFRQVRYDVICRWGSVFRGGIIFRVIVHNKVALLTCYCTVKATFSRRIARCSRYIGIPISFNDTNILLNNSKLICFRIIILMLRFDLIICF